MKRALVLLLMGGAFLALGEQSGMLPEAFAYLADLYADNTQMRQQILAQLLLR